MKKIVFTILIITIAILGAMAFAACSNYIKYNVTVATENNNYVEYNYNNGNAFFAIFNEQGEELARVTFGTGDSKGVTVSDTNEVSFSVDIETKYSLDGLKVYYNGVLMESSHIAELPDYTTSVYFSAAAPVADIIIRVEGLTGELKDISYIMPVIDSVPIYLKRGNDYVQVKSANLGMLSTLDYSIAFEPTTDGENAVFTFNHSDQIEYFIQIGDISLFRYEWEGHGTTGLYDVAEFDGEEEGYDEAGRLELERSGYAMCEVTTGGVFYRVYQTVIKDIQYSIVIID